MSTTRSRQRRQQRAGGAHLALIVAAVVTIAGVAALWANYNQRVAEATSEATSEATPLAPSQPATSETVAILGDSYMAGEGAGNAKSGMAERLAKALDAELANDSLRGTGYVSEGPYAGQSYAQRVEFPKDAEYLVIEGGYNDWLTTYQDDLHTPEDVRDAAREVYEAAADAAADETLVVGPFWPGADPAGGDILALRDILAEEADRAGLRFVDPIEEDWIDPSMIGPDGVHPTPAGHKVIAREIQAALG